MKNTLLKRALSLGMATVMTLGVAGTALAADTSLVDISDYSALYASVSSSIKLSNKSLNLLKGQTQILKITGTDKTVKWSSSNPSVVGVTSKGKITAKKVGKAEISAKVGKETYKCSVNVNLDISPSKSEVSIKSKDPVVLKVNLSKSIILKSSVSNSKIISCKVLPGDAKSKKLQITPKRNGTAVIKLKSPSTKEIVSIKVKVSGIEKENPTPVEPSDPICNIPIQNGTASWKYVAESSDDFNGSTLNDSKWSKGLWYDTSGQLAFKEDGISVADGNLVLTAKKEQFNGKEYTYGAVESKFDVPGSTEGPSYVEVRAKVLPSEANVLSAIWLQSSPVDLTQYPNPEIDMMESFSVWGLNYNTVSSALHLWPDGTDETHKALGGEYYDAGVDISKDYHTYGMLREGNKLTMFFDGKEIWTRDCTEYPELATMARHVVLSLEGHNGAPVDSQLPNSFLVDYVHTFVS